MKKGKLEKFQEVKELENVIESSITCREPLAISKTWRDDFFTTSRDITLELGCGRGEYTVALARRSPEKNFIGVDIKGARLWTGAVEARELALDNVQFLRTQINHLDIFFPPGLISEAWITFPDPHLKQPQRNAGNRLTSDRFLDIYKKIMKKGSQIHLKTDNLTMYEFTLERVLNRGGKLLDATDDLYNSSITGAPVEIQTRFEKRYLKEGIPIKYLRFSL